MCFSFFSVSHSRTVVISCLTFHHTDSLVMGSSSPGGAIVFLSPESDHNLEALEVLK